jgi:phage repressor protein C with HTH and peptisase S24 domain
MVSLFSVNPDWFLSGEGPMFRDNIPPGEGYLDALNSGAIRFRPSKEVEGDRSDPAAVRETLTEARIAQGIATVPTSRSGPGVPYYDIDVAAHWVSEVPGSEAPQPEFYVDFQPFNDCSAFLPVFGDSMFPMIASGDVVAVKEIKNRSIIQWGEAYLVLTNAESDNMRTVKLIHPHENPAYVNLRASNPNYKGDIPVPRDSIVGLYIVKGIVTRKQL